MATFTQLLISLIYYSCSVFSYSLHFPNNDQNNYLHTNNDRNNSLQRSQELYNFKRHDNQTENDWNAWSWNSNSKIDSSDRNSENPEERLIKFEILNDPPNQLKPSNSVHHDYWHDIYWPNRYAPRYGKGNNNWTTGSQYNHNYNIPISPSPPSLHHQQYHWQNLRPTDHYQHPHHYYKPVPTQTPRPTSNSLNFGFGASSSSSSSVLNQIHGGHGHGHKPSSLAGSASENIQHEVPYWWNGGGSAGTDTRKNSGDYYHQSNPGQYRRKRYRVHIHPGLIAAPIAGLAAFGAVSAWTTNPVLLELGLVNRNDDKVVERPYSSPRPAAHPHYYHHHHYYNHPTTTSSTHRPPYHHPHFPHSHDHDLYPPSSGTDFPVLLPPLSSDDKPSPERPWWNPFAAIIPRFRMLESYGNMTHFEKERDK